MIVEERTAAYLRALEPDMPCYLEELEKNAVADEVPIIRKDAQALLRFLMRARRPKRILEIGTAVGFSCMYMAEYMPSEARIATIEKVAMRVQPAKKNLAGSPRADGIALLIGDAADVLAGLAGGEAVYPYMEEHGDTVLAEEIRTEKCQNTGIVGETRMEECRNAGMAECTHAAPGAGSGICRGRAAAAGQGKKLRRDVSWEVYLPAGESSLWQDGAFCESYDFIFMDAAKGQYMNFLPYILKLLAPDGMFVTDNVLQEGSIAESKFAVERRDRTIHMRMREYLYELTHRAELNTAVLPVGDGMALCTFR